MKLTKRLLPMLILFAVVLPTSASAAEVLNGESLLRAMYDRYKTSWYSTLTFAQKTTTYNPDGTTKLDTWYEAAALPGKLRIDFGTPSEGNGAILVDGTATFLQKDKVVGTRPLINMLLVLGFDVYRQEPETTIKIVKGEGYDLAKIHEDTWEGKPAYVVGADKGDLKSKQFWIDKSSLLFVRLIEPADSDPKKVQDIRFSDYRPLAGGWVAAGVAVFVDDKKVFTEDYFDIQANVKLDPAMFDPKQFSTTHWEKP